MAKEVLDTIMSIQPKDSSGGTGETRESIVYRIADDMLNKLPPDYVPHEVCSVTVIFCVITIFFPPEGESKVAENGFSLFHEYLLASGN